PTISLSSFSLCFSLFCIFFFFFQAEDGIRDGHVTGVQTCALPISCGARARRRRGRARSGAPPPAHGRTRRGRDRAGGSAPSQRRSEERRVGKECRSRWSPEH